MPNTKTPAVERMLDHIAEECTPIDREQRFRDALDEIYSFESVGGPFAHMQPSKVLEEIDPVAFRCGVNDYTDSQDTYEIDGETYDQYEVDKAKQSYIDELADADEIDECEAYSL